MAHNRGSWLLVSAVCLGCVAFSGSSDWAQPPGKGAAPAKSTAAPPPVVEPLRTASDRPISIDNIRLNLRVDVEKKTVESKATLAFHCVRPTQTLSLDAVDFEIKKVAVKLGEKSVENSHHTSDGKKLIVDLGSRLRRRRRNARGELSDSGS